MAVNRVKNMYMHEIFDKVAEAKTRQEKIEILRNYNTRALRDVLKGAFDKSVVFNLPPGAPPYNKGSSDSPGTTLRKQCKKFNYFVATNSTPKATPKIEKIFVQMLEGLHPREAEIAVWMKDKDLAGKYKGLTKKLASDAFPGLISE